mgnify:FL=1
MNRQILKNNLPSFCTSNFDVLKIILLFSKYNNLPILIESTSNQVNQNGGYTGLNPSTFSKKIYSLAASVKLNKNMLVLGGDHLGPLPWKNLTTKKAIANSKKLVKAYVKAKYKKIHLDTAIICKNEKNLNKEEIVSRCNNILKEFKAKDLKNIFLVVGTEVPFAGGGQGKKIIPTKINTIKKEYQQYKSIFDINNIYKNKKFSLVIEPGIEFFHSHVKKSKLKKILEKKNFSKKNNFSFEAHSSDFQTKQDLQKLVKNNFQFLKVGPELTYYYSKAIFSMEKIERNQFKQVSDIKNNLSKLMKSNNKYWKDYYKGSKKRIEFLKFNSYLDRVRYYWNFKKIEYSKLKLKKDINNININLLSKILKLNKNQILIKSKLKLDNFEMIIYINLCKTLQKYYQACGFKIKN